MSDIKPGSAPTFIDGSALFSTKNVDFQISPTGKLGIGYSGQLSNDNNDHAMTVSFSLGF